MTAEDRIDELEDRLSEYHEWLVDSIAQRDRLAIDAAWGVHGLLNSIVVIVGLLYVFDRFVGWSGFLVSIGIGLAVAGINLVVLMWSNDARMKDVNKFALLPTWKSNRR